MTDLQALERLIAEGKDVRVFEVVSRVGIDSGVPRVLMEADYKTVKDLATRAKEFVCVLYVFDKNEFLTAKTLNP